MASFDLLCATNIKVLFFLALLASTQAFIAVPGGPLAPNSLRISALIDRTHQFDWDNTVTYVGDIIINEKNPNEFELIRYTSKSDEVDENEVIGFCSIMYSSDQHQSTKAKISLINNGHQSSGGGGTPHTVVVNDATLQAIHLFIASVGVNRGYNSITFEQTPLSKEQLSHIGFSKDGTTNLLGSLWKGKHYPLIMSDGTENKKDATISIGSEKILELEEMVDWVDTRGKCICSIPRLLVHKLNILHRGAGILVTNDKGEVYVHRRAAGKRVFPSLSDMFVGGVALAGEPAAATARREIQEELGIGFNQAVPLKYIFDCIVTTSYNRCYVSVYEYSFQSKYDKISWQEEEVEWGEFITMEKLLKWVEEDRNSFVPDGLIVWDDYNSFSLPIKD